MYGYNATGGGAPHYSNFTPGGFAQMPSIPGNFGGGAGSNQTVPGSAAAGFAHVAAQAAQAAVASSFYAAATSTNPYAGSAYSGASPHQFQPQPPPPPTARMDNIYTSATGTASGYGTNRTQSDSNSAQSSTTTNASGLTSTYTGYDAAVYAAATNYLQSKAHGQGNQWMGLKKGPIGGGTTTVGGGGSAWKKPVGGTGYGKGPNFTGIVNLRNHGYHKYQPGGATGRTFPNKRYGVGGASGGGGPNQGQLFYCEICKISCAGSQTYKEHLEGQRHKKKEALEKGSAQPALAKSRVSYRCELCGVTCTGKDTYDSHVRGSKHQKTVKLHTRLGKPIPGGCEPTVIAPTQAPDGTPLPKIAGGDQVVTRKIIGIPQMNFVGGTKLTSTLSNPVDAPIVKAAVVAAKSQAVEAALLAEQSVQPVGDDYVEAIKDHTGKLLQYFCKLCDCKFSDPNAKDIHMKGRRHRLMFKQKVNPNLEMEDCRIHPSGKVNPISNRGRRMLQEHRMQNYQEGHWNQRYPGPMPGAPVPLFGRPWFPQPQFSDYRPRGDSSDDRHVMAKHVQISLTDQQQAAIEKLVINAEKALKTISDAFADEDRIKSIQPAAGGEEQKNVASENKDRLLQGVMRVGLLAKALVLRGDEEIPTRELLNKVGTMLQDEIKKLCPEDTFTVTEDYGNGALTMSMAGIPMKCILTLTSVKMRESPEAMTAAATGGGTLPQQPPVAATDALPLIPCLEALAQLRHAKYFQARCAGLQSCSVVLRVIRDVCARINAWKVLSPWAVELLVEKVLTSCGVPLAVGDALRRVFEAIASGLLMETGPGIADPCEKEPVNVLAKLTKQQREDITASAQHAIRLIAFNQLHKVLAIDRLPLPGSTGNGDRKRPREANGTPGNGEWGFNN